MENLPLAKKRLGQHWLSDLNSLEAVRAAASLTDNDTVLEIGPGIGNLTKLLVERAARVVVVELDGQLADQLALIVSVNNLQVIKQDIMSFDLTTMPANYKVVSNIPFYLTSHLLKKLSESDNQASLVVLLVQKELAERAAAQTGATSLLSISLQYYWQVSLGQIVPARLFVPPPKVDSQILILKKRDQPIYPDVDRSVFFRVVRAGFAGRRKKLLNSLSAGLSLDKVITASILREATISPNLRAQNLTIEAWYDLYKAFLTITSPKPKS